MQVLRLTVVWPDVDPVSHLYMLVTATHITWTESGKGDSPRTLRQFYQEKRILGWARKYNWSLQEEGRTEAFQAEAVKMEENLWCFEGTRGSSGCEALLLTTQCETWVWEARSAEARSQRQVLGFNLNLKGSGGPLQDLKKGNEASKLPSHLMS